MKSLSILTALAISLLPAVNGYTTYVPNTVSPQAQNHLRTLIHDPSTDPSPPSLTNTAGWNSYCASYQNHKISEGKPVLDSYKPVITKKTIAGVPVYEVLPKNYIDNGKVIVYVHGGLAVASAESSLSNAALIANGTGFRVINIDYATCLNAKWQTITDQVVSVVNDLDNVTLVGSSAGGGIGSASILRGAEVDKLVLISPWVDLTESGDTYNTLKTADPITSYEKHLEPSALIYAGGANMKDPFVSPVYGNVKHFPPTLIQGGTKDIFLSGFLRMYQNLDNSGVPVKLDLYEGMIHSFQFSMYDTPESKLAFSKILDFISDNI